MSVTPSPRRVSLKPSYATFMRVMIAAIAAAPYTKDKYSIVEPLRTSLRAVPGGVVAEFGVFRGTTLKIISAVCAANCHIFAFDSFHGLPSKWRDKSSKRTERKYTGAGAFSLRGQVPRLGLKNVAYSVGLFNESLPSFLETMSHKKAAFVHVDGDLYDSAKDVLCSFVERNMITNGTVVVFDELIGYPEFKMGEMKALYDCFQPLREKFDVHVLERGVKYVREAYERDVWPQSVAIMVTQLHL